MVHMWQQVTQCASRMGPQGWVLVLAAMIVLGLVCLRGYGSRSGY